jgi:hypothetical protein
VDFVPGNSNKLQKLGLEGKIRANVFTLGPTAHATCIKTSSKTKVKSLIFFD